MSTVTSRTRSAPSIADLVDTHDHHVLESVAHELNALDDKSEVIQDQAKFIGRLADLDELAQPRQGDLHENCSKKRVSFSMSARMSAIS